jgi:hypothetical protein
LPLSIKMVQKLRCFFLHCLQRLIMLTTQDELFDGSLFQHLGAVRDLYPDASIKQLRETVESK